MKKIFLQLIFILYHIILFGQNLQIHYELSSNKNIGTTHVVTKTEMLGADSLGLYYWNSKFGYILDSSSITIARGSLLRSIEIPSASFIHGVVGTIVGNNIP